MSRSGRDSSWETANRDCLVAELGVLRARVRGDDSLNEAERQLDDARKALAQRSSLDEVSGGFGLSDFERAMLLLAAGPELVAATAEELAVTGGGPQPSFGLGLSVIPDAHWSAITPTGPLRRWNLVRLLDPVSPTRSPLIADERVLHHLTGAGYLDPELAVLTRRVTAQRWLPATLVGIGEALAEGWRHNRLVVLHGPQRGNLAAVAAATAATAGLDLFILSAADLPMLPADRVPLLRLMERETVLAGAAWAVDVEGARLEDIGAQIRSMPGLDAPAVILGNGEDLRFDADALRIRVPRLPIAERREALAHALRHNGSAPPIERAQLDAAAGAFDLALPDIDAAAADVARGVTLWEACRSRSRNRFDAMAQVIEPRAGWADLVLPDTQLEQLHALVAAVRHQVTVLDDWGFARRSARGLGTTALFAGPSGTGKTMAAEVVARDLGLDLVVVDLSQVVSKYIGETEKNLRRVFDAAEDGAAVLLFDEADTLFGKRTEVRDSHDRYANLEVGYLLQRMESFRGLAILTTNARSALDQAFVRRLRAIVTFPYPDLNAREALWRNAFPARTPVADLDARRLATLDLPGGGIAAAALTAAYLGAEAGSVSADDVAMATGWELAKSGRTASVNPGARRGS